MQWDITPSTSLLHTLHHEELHVCADGAFLHQHGQGSHGWVKGEIREEMRLSVEELSTNVAKIEKAVLKQNGVVLGISKTLEATSQDIKTSVDLKFNDLSQQIQELRSLMSSLLPSPALQAVTQLGGQFPG